jgi:UDPglucose 6-dehydrogenase/GDP-mannose 6-dehydrogenase
MKIGMMGAGRVGCASALLLCELGHDLTLYDVDRTRVAQLVAGDVPFFEAGIEAALQAATASGRWAVTDRAGALAACDALMIAVPTPAGADAPYDLGCLRTAADTVRDVAARAGRALRWRGIFLRSTVLPGTTAGVLGTVLGGVTNADGDGVPIGYLPEFFREGSMLADARRPDRIVVGADDPDLHALARAIFADLDTTWLATGIATAELIKTTSNAFLSTCISFANEIARVAETIDGVDAVEVLTGLHLDRRFSGTARAGIVEFLRPGPGFGGSCLPKDLAALAAFGDARDGASILDAALRINRTQPAWLVDRIDRELHGLRDRRVLVLGLAFKPGTDDLRDSITLPVCRELAGRHASIRAHDPRVDTEAARALFGPCGVTVVTDEDWRQAFDDAEAVVLVTPWPSYLETLPALLAARATPLLFVDTRGILRGVDRAANVTYLGIGARPARSGGAA